MTLADIPADELRAMLARQTRDPRRVRTLHECEGAGCARGTEGTWCAVCLREEVARRKAPPPAPPGSRHAAERGEATTP
jgi:hypothetical protein